MRLTAGPQDDGRLNQSIGARHQQNVEKQTVNISFPNYTLNVNRLFPFEKLSGRVPDWVRKLNLSYNFSLSNRITNVPARTGYARVSADNLPPAFSWDNLPTFLREAKNGARHGLPISTAYTLLKRFPSSINFNYTELWYAKKLRHTYDAASNTTEQKTINAFSRAGYYTLSHSTQTRLYGTLYLKGDKIKAIRHVINPSLSFSYRPDFSQKKYGVYQHIDTPSAREPLLRSAYDGFVYGTTPRGALGSVGFSISNRVEAKVSNTEATDVANKPFRNITLIDNIAANTTYNFLAESFPLAPIRLSTRFSALKKKLSVNVVGVLDPYLWEPVAHASSSAQKGTYKRVNVLAWQAGQSIGQLTSSTVSMGLNLDNQAIEDTELAEDTASSDGKTPEGGAGEGNEEPYGIPWSLHIGYTLNYRKKNLVEDEITKSAYLTGRVSLTALTHVNVSLGYDFQQRELRQLGMNFTRDLHCWEFVGSWIPFGRFTSYEVTIRAKGTLLNSLRFNRQRSFFDPL